MNNHSVIPAFDFREMVQAKNGEVVTTSRKIAKYFGKRHGDVLRKIEQVKADCSREFSQRNFASADYIDEQGKVRPMYSLTKDGWIMVVMGFTGKAAAAIKESYIPHDILGYISQGMVVIAVLAQFVRQSKLKDKAVEMRESK